MCSRGLLLSSPTIPSLIAARPQTHFGALRSGGLTWDARGSEDVPELRHAQRRASDDVRLQELRFEEGRELERREGEG